MFPKMPSAARAGNNVKHQHSMRNDEEECVEQPSKEQNDGHLHRVDDASRTRARQGNSRWFLFLTRTAPNAAAHVERVIGTLKRECLNHFVFLSEGHLRRTAKKFAGYYNSGRSHQGIRGIPDLGPGVQRGPGSPPDESSRLVVEPILGGHPRLPARSLAHGTAARMTGCRDWFVSIGSLPPNSH